MQADPVGIVGPPVGLNFNAAGHAFLDEWGVQLTHEIDSLGEDLDSEDDGSDGSGWGRQRPGMGPDPVVWTPRTQGGGNPQ